jgi:hypothetical protein
MTASFDDSQQGHHPDESSRIRVHRGNDHRHHGDE